MVISASIFTSDKPLAYAKYLEKTEIDFLHMDFLEDESKKIDLTQLKKYKRIKKPLDVHLVCSEINEEMVEILNNSNTEILSVQVENLNDVNSAMKNLKHFKRNFGFAITPKTDWRLLIPYKELMSHILVMCSIPGVSGAKFMENSYEFINQIAENFKGIKIYADGGINYDVYRKISSETISLIIMGSYLYNNRNNMQYVINKFNEN